MKKKHSKKIIQLIAFLTGGLLLCSLLFFAGKKAYHILNVSLLSTHSLSYSFKDFHTTSLTDEISAFLDKKINDQNNNIFTGEQLYETVLEYFPMIKTVTWKKKGPTVHIELTASPLCYRINQDYIAYENNYLMPKKSLDYSDLNHLPLITINPQEISESSLNKRVGECLARLSTSFFQAFSLSYHNDSKIILSPNKIIPNLHTIIANEATLDENNIKKVINHLAYIKKDCLNETQDKENLILDIRFKNRIVVKKAKRNRV